MEETSVSQFIPESELNVENQLCRGRSAFKEPIDLLGLVDYQEGAVISRPLMNSEEGTVTLFAFDRGQGLSEHTSPFDALVQVLEGSVQIFVSGNPMQLTAGQIVTLPANKPHSLSALSKFKMLLTTIRSQ